MKLGKTIIAVYAGLFTIPQGYAATMETVWGNIASQTELLSAFSLVQKSTIPTGLTLPEASTTKSENTLQFVKGHRDSFDVSHARYNQYYQDIPVWAAQVIYHTPKQGLNNTVTGQLVKDIAQDIPQLDAKLSVDNAKDIAQRHSPGSQNMVVKKIIYLKNKSHKAVMAYLVSYAANKNKMPSLPHFIIDANTGEILRFWDGLQTGSEIGQGYGGFTFSNLKYRPGRYQFGVVRSGIKTLNKLNITFKSGVCYATNFVFSVINLKNKSVNSLPFELPVSSLDAKNYRLNPFSYPCSAPNYRNVSDNNSAPVNGGWSPVNDVIFFVKKAYDMYIVKYNVASPIEHKQLRLYTHIDDYDNAFACSPACMRDSGINGPQQLVFGNGGVDDAPYTDIGTSGHEFAHIVTDNFSELVYDGQSGGINESFSDMAEFALKSYLKAQYPWIWDGKDWTIGLETSKVKKPLRYMNNPPLDGDSIDDARDYYSGLDVHHSSGVFNKAFYLLSVTSGWSVDKAFRVMLDANMNYWTPRTSFNRAACGVIQAAKQRGYKYQDVISAFNRVGVFCGSEAPLIG
ncbi:M4 family metallopeptidase [Legionella hackeliae]|uniref:Neutral metalloproteinase n=1 Tax=Legionella hackeliae TaxID=449 RepID=A0A0A8UTE8_LEGHA|nr:M4 family metallopeptidase [Legionella hackeliae]KTD10536.1 virulence metalloprotease [Legionella hackeliae]CEK10039.1 Virulence metalloprotease precursor (Vibriolysin) [Legionella hackeliae]STX46764.1 virulence metalloprotease [Legionella hackeliae]